MVYVTRTFVVDKTNIYEYYKRHNIIIYSLSVTRGIGYLKLSFRVRRTFLVFNTLEPFASGPQSHYCLMVYTIRFDRSNRISKYVIRFFE